MAKFKIRDRITAKEHGRGFEDAIVLGTYTGKYGRFRGKEMYLLKIMNGTATVPVSVEDNYQLVDKKR